MNSAINNPSLKTELEYAHALKAHTNQLLEIMNPGHHQVEANLNLLAERIFKYLSENQSISDLKELKSISDLIQKHTAAYNKIKTLEIKTRQLLLKEKLHQLELQNQEQEQNQKQNYNQNDKNTKNKKSANSSNASASQLIDKIFSSFPKEILSSFPKDLCSTITSKYNLSSLPNTNSPNISAQNLIQTVSESSKPVS